MLHLILLFCLWFCALWFFRCTKLRSLWRLMCAVGKRCCRVTESWCFSHNFILLISCLYFVIIYFYFISFLLFPCSHKQNNKWVWPISAMGKKIKKEKKACGLDVRKTRMHFESNIVEARIRNSDWEDDIKLWNDPAKFVSLNLKRMEIVDLMRKDYPWEFICTIFLVWFSLV